MRIKRAALPIVLGVLLGPAVGSAAAATTWHVTSTGDPASGTACPATGTSPCTLRQAISQAVSGDTIDVPAGQITLTPALGPLPINASITIDGAGQGSTIVDGGGASRVIHIDTPDGLSESTATLTLENLTVTGGSVTRSPAQTQAGGAGIQADTSGGLYLKHVTVSGNTFNASTVATNADNIGGAGILSLSTVVLTDSTVSGNTLTIDGAQGASGGGGVLVTSGDLILAGSTVSNNTATVTEGTGSFGRNGGGGIFFLGESGGSDDLILEDSTISGNTFRVPTPVGNDADDDGGGGLLTGGISVLSRDSTLSGNNADLRGDLAAAGGGAVLDFGGGSAYTNTTFAGNTVQFTTVVVDQGGGAIYYGNSGLSSLANDTFAGNSATSTPTSLNPMGASIYDEGTALLPADTIFSSGSASTVNCVQNSGDPGTVDSGGYNLYDDSSNSCGLLAAGDQLSSSLHLGPLANNGGPAETDALLAGSAAINAGNPSGCTDAFGHALATDERGVARPQPAGGRCDVGADEVAPPVASTGIAGALGNGAATLQGTAVNPDVLAGAAHFQYGPTTRYGKTTPAQAVGAQSTDALHAALAKLARGTYHYRLVVTNPDGTTDGADSTFFVSSAPRPAGQTGPAVKIGAHGATLTGQLDGFGLKTKFQFQIGTTRKYKVTTKAKSGGSHNGIVSVSVTVKGLKPGRKYHYRIVVTSSGGRVTGSDKTFKTKR
jgi:hypothetical protein